MKNAILMNKSLKKQRVNFIYWLSIVGAIVPFIPIFLIFYISFQIFSIKDMPNTKEMLLIKSHYLFQFKLNFILFLLTSMSKTVDFYYQPIGGSSYSEVLLSTVVFAPIVFSMILILASIKGLNKMYAKEEA